MKSTETKKRVQSVWSLVTLLLVLLPGLMFGQSRKMSRELQTASGPQPLNVIVQFTQAPTAKHHQKVTGRGGSLKVELGTIKAGAYSVPASALADLANDPDVAFISPDRPVKVANDFTTAATGASTAWNFGYTGAGISVAVIDSGINDNHADFWTSNASRVIYRQDFTGTTAYANGSYLFDTYGHGTHVAGILGGNGTWSYGQYKGVAPNVNFVDLRVLDKNGVGSDSMVIAAIQRAIQLKGNLNIRVINLSIGRPVYGVYAQDPLCAAVEQAWQAGIVVVVAAGNYGRVDVGNQGYGTITSPGNDPYVITVGAMKTNATYGRGDDTIASYSSKGPSLYDHVVKPDLVAPGNLIKSVVDHGSTLDMQNQGNERVGGYPGYYDYFVMSGTSMATPAVAGAAALLLQKNPQLTPDQVKARLMKTAYKTFPASSTAVDPASGVSYTSYYDLFTVGAGYLDIAAAINNNDLVTTTLGTALSPTAVYNTSTNTVSLVNGNSVIWGGSVAWGTNSPAGSSVVWGTTTTTPLASSVVWGTDASDAALTMANGDQ